MTDEQKAILKDINKEELLKELGIEIPQAGAGAVDTANFIKKEDYEKAKKELNEEAKKYRLAKETAEKLLTDAQTKVTSLEVEANQFKTAQKELETLRTEIKTELLSKLPEVKRKDYENFDITQLRIVTRDLNLIQNSPGGEGTPGGSTTKPLTEMTAEEISNLHATNPALYQKMLKEMVNTQFKS
jgi:sRNA-binding carbon storage regulator CsrA